jgi:NAD(P)-dependent dehydrogenase (short-subunit alcohol dehydrogenase family)
MANRVQQLNGLSRFSLAGRVAAVTGASSGLGRAMAGYLAEAGARVVCVARRADMLSEAVGDINNAGGEAAPVIGDLLDRLSVTHLAEQCSEPFGPPHIVVNAAGVNLREPIDDITLESWDQTLNLNLGAPFFFSRELVPEMRKAGYGRIINIASLQSSRAFANGLPYGTSKGGICQLTRAMAEAWSSQGITANAIAPGFFPTELTAPVFADPSLSNTLAEKTAIGRNGELDDLAGVTVFLAAPASAYVTGQTLYVDGGFTAK